MNFSEGDRIYRYSLYAPKTSNNVRVERESEHVLKIQFSNLDRNDGVVVDMLHDSAMEYPSIEGTILEHKGFKDCGEIMRIPNRRKFLSNIVIALSLLVVPGIVILMTAGFKSNGPGLIAFGLLNVILVVWRNRQKIPKPLIPHIRRIVP